MRSKAFAVVVPLVLLAACSTSSPAAKPSPSTSARQFAAHVRSVTALPLPNGRLEQLATAVCDDISINGNDAPDAAVMLQQAPDTGSLTDSQANDFVQAAVLYACPDLYNPGDYLHPGRFKIR